MDTKKILLIDDDESTLESISSYLEESGYKVFTARNGITGLEVVKNLCPDVIISDIRMSGLNGIEFAYIIKGLRYNIPIILISSFDNNDNKFIEKCSFGYIQKPLDIHKLNEMINDALISGMINHRESVNF
ncbi:MAG: response regulator [Ignavibacteria bacterium]|nr:response regulator [Ignavibacteria bacterium]